ncbi:MAG TPA: lipoyl(octanoyl) transferase LipB [Lautropia sp.]|jgi:lipoyl(octanoyl) transferase|nr:lipoyl(octanoyl) transferase LipB [Lautropia sp.]
MITVRELGVTAYSDALERMRRHVAARAADRDAMGDEIWLTEHPPVFTLGFASRPEHLRTPGTIAVVETERGGQVTYHGPGQVVAYALLDLRKRKLGVRSLVCRLEEGIIRCLAGYGIAAVRRPGAPGIYVRPRLPEATTSPAKIASIGLKVSRGLTWHGVALNGLMDLEPFSRIDPCGYPGQVMTDVAHEADPGVPVDPRDLAQRLASELVGAIEG